MTVNLDAGNSQFPVVNAVDASKQNNTVNLTFLTRVEGQGAALRVTLTVPQWENLKFLVEGQKPAEN